MPLSRSEENGDAQREGIETIVTGFADADSPDAITTAEFEAHIGPVHDPFNVAPIDLDSPNATAINNTMPLYLVNSLHEDPNAYMGHTSQAEYTESSSSNVGTPLSNEIVTVHHQMVSPGLPHIVSPVQHYGPSMQNATSPEYHASTPMQHIAPPMRDTESPAPPMPNLMAAVLHPMEVHHGHITPPYAMMTGLDTGVNLYTFNYCAPSVVHAPGQLPRRIDGGPEEDMTHVNDAGVNGMTLPEVKKRIGGRFEISKKSGGVKKSRRTRGQKARPPAPSRFCHICLRRGERVKLKACANLENKSCRKVTCERCFEEFKWDWVAACDPATNWSCTHCRNVCPERAQCFIYKRTNNRRHQALMEKKSREMDKSMDAQKDRDNELTTWARDTMIMQDLQPISFVGDEAIAEEQTYSAGTPSNGGIEAVDDASQAFGEGEHPP